MSRTAGGKLLRAPPERLRSASRAPDRGGRRKPKLVSVVIAARNARETIAAQLHALAGQCYPAAWELVVVDDGSRDGTSATVTSEAAQLGLTLRCLRNHANAGRSAARNLGARAARGDLIVFCDADDVVCPDWLAELVAAGGGADQVAGFLDSHSLNLGQRGLGGVPADRLHEVGGLPYAASSNMAVWADVLAAAGGFDERRHRNADVELSVRLRRHGYRLTFAPRAVVYYRHRSTVPALARKAFGTGLSTVQLYRDLRGEGMTRSLSTAWEGWVALLRRSPGLIDGSREQRLRWAGLLGFRCGRLAGCVRYRTLYP